MEVVAHRALRATVDDEGHRIFHARHMIPRLDHVAMHGFAIPAGKTELLVLTQAYVGQRLLVERGQHAFATAIGPCRIHLRGRGQRAAREHQGVAAKIEPFHHAHAGQTASLAAGDVDDVDRMVAGVVHCGIDALAIGRERDAMGREIPIRRDLARSTVGKLLFHQCEAIGLESGALHGQVIQGTAIGTEHRPGIPGWIVAGEIDRRGRCISRHVVEIKIGGPWLALSCDTRRKHQTLAIG